MPELEALAPLRALLVSIARPDEATVWSSSGPYLTLGKRGVHPDELRRRMPQAFQRITEHLQVLFKAYVEALECQQRADAPGVVAALVRAGRLEEEVGRHTQARNWYEVALRVAEATRPRRRRGVLATCARALRGRRPAGRDGARAERAGAAGRPAGALHRRVRRVPRSAGLGPTGAAGRATRAVDPLEPGGAGPRDRKSVV